MNWKKKLLKKSRLYVIVDKKVLGERFIFNIVSKIKKDKGYNIIQLRDKISKKEIILKEAQLVRKMLLNTKTLFIINDYLDIAKIVDSDGVHLGQSDSSIEIARKLLGKDKIIGVSCHNSKQAIIAQKNGADYISIGPIFLSSTKPELKALGLDPIREFRKKIKIPFFAIGGINQSNLVQVLSAGAKKVAVCRAICQARNVSSKLRILFKILN